MCEDGGSCNNTSAQALEGKHLHIKSAAEMTNQRSTWLLQILLREKRMDDTAYEAATGTPGIGGASCERGEQTSTRDFCVWPLLMRFRETVRILGARAKLGDKTWFVMDLAALAWRQSVWLKQDVYGDMEDLAYTMAKYLQDDLSRVVPAMPSPSNEKDKRLTAMEMHQILKHVQPFQQHPARRGHLAVYNHIRIQHHDFDTYVSHVSVPAEPACVAMINDSVCVGRMCR
jgi:hypothetical protein